MNHDSLIQLDKNEPITWGEFCHIYEKELGHDVFEKIKSTLQTFDYVVCNHTSPPFRIQRMCKCTKCLIVFPANRGNVFREQNTERELCEECFLGITTDPELRKAIIEIAEDAISTFCSEMDIDCVSSECERKIKRAIKVGVEQTIHECFPMELMNEAVAALELCVPYKQGICKKMRSQLAKMGKIGYKLETPVNTDISKTLTLE